MTPGEQACNDLKVTLKEYFESKLSEVERRLVSLNDLNKVMSQDRALFVSRELHDRLQSELSELEKIVTALTTKISTWFMVVAGAYGLIQIILSVVFYHLFHKGS